MAEFIIVFREVLEASLVVGIIYLLLEKTNQTIYLPKLWYGVVASIIASVAVGFLVIQAKSALGNDSTKALFEAVFLFITAFLIWYVIFWLSKNVSNKKVLEDQTLNAIELSSWGIFFVVFFAILREGFETAIFLISSFSITGVFSYLGFFLGALLAIMIGLLIVRQGRKVNLQKVFQYTTLLLVFLASGMIAYGTHEAEEYLVKSEQIEETSIYRVWNILEPSLVQSGAATSYHPLHDKGTMGVFLKGFFGYNSNPNILEVILWVLATMFGLNMWRRFYY
jgi:high-affinity iron transporter|tara:strand:- start:311 stop:1153 length:843 start_codon:yes stop_codon:yes gene_type:complete